MKVSIANSDYTTKDHEFVQHPIKALKFILGKLRIKELLDRFVRDPRSRIDRYSLSSLLMQGLSTHLFRCPSKNKFQLHLKRPQACKALAKFTGATADRSPCTRTIDDLFLSLNPEDFAPILPSIFRRLCRGKVFQLHPELIPQGEYAVAVDAQVTHTYHEDSQHPCQCCPYCLKRSRQDKVWYHHVDLVASFIAPNGLQIPLLFHRIRARPEWRGLGDARWKQECERTAFPFLLRKLRQEFPRLKFCVHLDALYATDPVFSLLEELKLGYSVVRKAKVLSTVGQDCEGLIQLSSPVEASEEKGRFNIRQTIHFFNEIAYRGHQLHLIKLEEDADKRSSKRFAKLQHKHTHWEWIVHQKLNPSNVQGVATQSRIRWKQEEFFNDLQCRGFSILHDFNRAPVPQLIRTYLILIAYAICSILTYSTFGRAILACGYTISFIMEQMLTDLIYLPDMITNDEHSPFQLRLGKDPPY